MIGNQLIANQDTRFDQVQGLPLINERETSKNLQTLSLVAAFSAIYLLVLACKSGVIKKLL